MSAFYKNVYMNQKARAVPDPIGDQLRVYQYPMQTDTNNPKIPDGKAAMSCGIKVMAVSTLRLKNNVGHLLMFPGMNNGLSFYNLDHVDNTMSEGNMGYPKHARVTVRKAPIDETTDGLYDPVMNQGEMRWRLVSQQLKLTSVNGGDDYDGWWECIRMTCIPSEFQRYTTETVTPTSEEGADPNTYTNVLIGRDITKDLMKAFPIDSPLVNNHTYCTGKIKDLHRFNFQLLPSLNNHDFVELDNIGNTKYNRYREGLLDKTFDCWYMRLHGTPESGGAVLNGEPTTIMAHLVSNQEIIYREDRLMTRYHSECYDALYRVNLTRKQMHLNTKAAKPMYGGGV